MSTPEEALISYVRMFETEFAKLQEIVSQQSTALDELFGSPSWRYGAHAPTCSCANCDT